MNATKLTQIRAAAARKGLSTLTSQQLMQRVTHAGNTTLLNYGVGYYRAMAMKSVALRKKTA